MPPAAKWWLSRPPSEAEESLARTAMEEVGLSTNPQRAMLHYVIPTLAVLLVLASPLLLLGALGNGSVQEELKAAVKRRLSLMSIVILVLSCIFLISSYDMTPLVYYASYCIVLALANLIADRVGKRRGWLALSVWHGLNLINLLGGVPSFLQLFSMGSKGIIGEAFAVSGPHGESCPKTISVDYCSDGWIAVQVLVAFLYVVMHVVAFLYVGLETMKIYGGADHISTPPLSTVA